MLDLLTLLLFVLFLVHFYLFKFKQYLWWHKLNEDEAFISEYHHIYTPSASLPMQQQIESAHEMKAGHIIEIINYGQEEVTVDVFNDKKEMIYHFFCPHKLLFSGEYNHTHYLPLGKKYSFFMSSVQAQCPLTFRQVPFEYIKAPESLSQESEIIHYQEDNIMHNYILAAKKKYALKNIQKANVKSAWPAAGVIMEISFLLKAGISSLVLTTNKNCEQSIEIIQSQESYFIPITENNKIWTHWLTSEEDTYITIIERCHNLNKYSKTNSMIRLY